jgi:hypothetical protein
METIAAFGSPVGRSYTLHVANSMFKEGRQGSESAHILGWDNSTNGNFLIRLLALSACLNSLVKMLGNHQIGHTTRQTGGKLMSREI